MQVRILCARCHREVETIDAFYNVLHQGTYITVTCHGEKQRVFLGDEDRYSLTDRPGIAFREQTTTA